MRGADDDEKVVALEKGREGEKKKRSRPEPYSGKSTIQHDSPASLTNNPTQCYGVERAQRDIDRLTLCLAGLIFFSLLQFTNRDIPKMICFDNPILLHENPRTLSEGKSVSSEPHRLSRIVNHNPTTSASLLSFVPRPPGFQMSRNFFCFFFAFFPFSISQQTCRTHARTDHVLHAKL